MTNEEKATEIAIQRKKHYFDADALIINSEVECYASAIDMAKWKDEQHKQEKQKLIDKAAEWLRMTTDFFNNGEFNTEKFVNDFKQTMKGGK